MMCAKKSEPPAPPVEKLPDNAWQHHALYQGVRDAISCLPLYFRTDTVISGIMATDLFTLGPALGATIEEQVVNTLNTVRDPWDPKHRYELFQFQRQPQTFPDVLLRKSTVPGEIIMGLELKGWYLLAKEEEPSFRFQVSPGACNPQDLIVVVPWALSNVISGTPKIFAPYIVSAQFAAEYRNYHWKYLREAQSQAEILSPTEVSPYPKKSDAITDKPVYDGGGNFGRLSRTGIMDSYLHEISRQSLCGIEARYWRTFFKAFRENKTPEVVHAEVQKLIEGISREGEQANEETLARVRTILTQIEGLVSE